MEANHISGLACGAAGHSSDTPRLLSKQWTVQPLWGHWRRRCRLCHLEERMWSHGSARHVAYHSVIVNFNILHWWHQSRQYLHESYQQPYQNDVNYDLSFLLNMGNITCAKILPIIINDSRHVHYYVDYQTQYYLLFATSNSNFQVITFFYFSLFLVYSCS